MPGDRKRNARTRRRIWVPLGMKAVGRSSPTSSYESSGHATDGGGSGSGKYRLMLVDDEEALRRAVSEYLEQASASKHFLIEHWKHIVGLRLPSELTSMVGGIEAGFCWQTRGFTQGRLGVYLGTGECW